MIRSSRPSPRAKAIAEILAMIADAHPEISRVHPSSPGEEDERLGESATEFCATLDFYSRSACRRAAKH